MATDERLREEHVTERLREEHVNEVKRADSSGGPVDG
jgi:hypothetical protein